MALRGRQGTGKRAVHGFPGQVEQKRVRELIIKRALSVRQLEDLVKTRKKSSPKKGRTDEEDYYFQTLTDNLKRSLGTKVEIRKRGKQGSIVIHFYSDDELGRLLDLLSG